jgi:DNA-binding transcriptional LysR family regulator
MADDVLHALGRQRRVVVTTPFMLFLPTLVAELDACALIPERALESATSARLRVFDPPFEMPTLTLAMVWHERADARGVHRWLRERVGEVAMKSRSDRRLGGRAE